VPEFVAKVKVPACWKKLIDVVFPDDLEGITSEKYQNGIADPEPHYDDHRTIDGSFEDGAEFTLALSSGQGNYYGDFSVWKNGQRLTDDEPLEQFDHVEFTLEDGTSYALEIEWIED